MHRPDTAHRFRCVTCKTAIVHPAVFHVGLPFCCAGCVANGPCSCRHTTGPGDVRSGRRIAADAPPAGVVLRAAPGEMIHVVTPVRRVVTVLSIR
jgi:hypothetical protein